MKSIFSTLIFALLAIDLGAQCNNLRDYKGLRALYLATDGDNWTDRTGWPDATYFANNPNPLPVPELFGWYGLDFCQYGRIREIYLGYNNLVGYLPSDIAQLDSLTALDVQGNYIGGSIPAEIFSLKLRNLSLRYNDFMGSIPTEIGNATSLGTIYLAYNNLSGPIPSSIGNLLNLSVFDANFNSFSGTLPSEIGNCKDLYHFKVENNNIDGGIPNSFNQLSNLLIFDVAFNELSGCYDVALKSAPSVLCNFSDGGVSLGNDFCIPWNDFCQGQDCFINNYIGPPVSDWYESVSYWSLGVFPTACHQVTIVNGATVTLHPGEVGYGLTLEVSDNSCLEVQLGGEMDVIYE